METESTVTTMELTGPEGIELETESTVTTMELTGTEEIELEETLTTMTETSLGSSEPPHPVEATTKAIVRPSATSTSNNRKSARRDFPQPKNKLSLETSINQ